MRYEAEKKINHMNKLDAELSAESERFRWKKEELKQKYRQTEDQGKKK